MDDSHAAGAVRPPSRPEVLARLLLGLSVLTVLVAVLLPPHVLSWLRSDYWFLGQPLNWLERMSLGVDVTHVILFAWVGFLASCLWRKSPWSHIAMPLLALALASELLQFLVPGRHPRVGDLCDNLLGAAIGVVLAIALGWFARRTGLLPVSQTPSQTPSREWLAAVLRDEMVVNWPQSGSEALAVAAAMREGVVTLVHQRLHEGPCASLCPTGLRNAFAAEARVATARSLAHYAESSRIATLLAEARVPALLLKGAALGSWLYPSPHLRECGDIDLLLGSRAEVNLALGLLSDAGYSVPVRTISGDLVSYELLGVGSRFGSAKFEIDLHWKLCNTPLFCDSLHWEELLEEAIPLPGLCRDARGLAPVHALIHACLHRAHNLQFGMGNQLRWLYDVKLLAHHLDGSQWRQLASLAQVRGVAGVCTHGLLASQRDLGANVPKETLTALSLASREEKLKVDRMQSWLYAQWATVGSLPTMRLRVRWIRQRLFPDLQHLREQYHSEGRSLPVILWRRLLAACGRIRAAP